MPIAIPVHHANFMHGLTMFAISRIFYSNWTTSKAKISKLTDFVKHLVCMGVIGFVKSKSDLILEFSFWIFFLRILKIF